MTEQREPESGILPTSDEVVTALRNAGWLLEQDTARTLKDAGFIATTAKAFPDPDDPSVSREIDVHGYRQLYRNDQLSFDIGIRILAECKQSSMPYVLVGGPADEYEKNRDREEQQFRFPIIETQCEDLGDGRSRIHGTPAREYLMLDKVPGNPWEGGFVGSQMTRLDRKKSWIADNRGIFTSLVYPLAKAQTYFKSQFNKSRYVMHKPGQAWAHIGFYYPIVVTSSPLFVVDITASKIEAIEVPWATMTREIKSSKIDGRFNIDIVTSAELKFYLWERVNKFGEAVERLATSNPERFITHQDFDYSLGIFIPRDRSLVHGERGS